MKWLFKFLKWMFLIGLVLLAGAILARNFLARHVAQIATREVTGFRLAIESVQIGWGSLQVDNLRLHNPAEFPEPAFVELPRLNVQYEVGSVLALKPHVRQLHLDLRELVLVTDEKGQSNLQRLIASTNTSSNAPTTKAKRPFKADVVTVHVGTVRYVDYSKGEPRERKQVLDLNLRFENLDENTNLAALLFGSVLRNVRIPELKGVTDSLAGQLGGVGESLQKTGNDLLGVFKKKK